MIDIAKSAEYFFVKCSENSNENDDDVFDQPRENTALPHQFVQPQLFHIEWVSGKIVSIKNYGNMFSITNHPQEMLR